MLPFGVNFWCPWYTCRSQIIRWQPTAVFSNVQLYQLSLSLSLYILSRTWEVKGSNIKFYNSLSLKKVKYFQCFDFTYFWGQIQVETLMVKLKPYLDITANAVRLPYTSPLQLFPAHVWMEILMKGCSFLKFIFTKDFLSSH